MRTDLTAKARKLAGIIKVPDWRDALRHHRVAAGAEHAAVLRTVADIGADRG